MAWTAPFTAVANTSLPAATWNTHVRDNLLETAPAKASGSGTYFVGTGVNAIAERNVGLDFVVTSQTTGSGSYTDLATVGPSITVTTGTRAIICITAQIANNTVAGSSLVACDISGAHTEAAADSNSLQLDAGVANQELSASHVTMYSLTAGSSTFRLKYRVSAGTGTFARRKLVVMPF